MASFVYTEAKRAILAGEIDFDAATIKFMIVMSNTTVGNGTGDDGEDIANIAGFTTLDEYDGANYVQKTLAGKAVAADNPNDRGEFTANAVTWTALGAGARSAQAILMYLELGGDTSDMPIAYLDDDFPFTGNGSDVTWTPNAEGILQAT